MTESGAGEGYAEQAAEHARRRAGRLHAEAVRRELEAISLHETLADQLRRAAQEDRRMAERARDPSGWQAAADRAEQRAAAAEERARHARERLREEGVDPDLLTGIEAAAYDAAAYDAAAYDAIASGAAVYHAASHDETVPAEPGPTDVDEPPSG